MEGSIGNALRDARLKKHLTVEEVARVTKMRPDRITDLERDDYMRFPNIAYARSFLVLYAKFLGVDIKQYPTVEVGSTVGLGDYQYLRSEETEQPSRTRPSMEPSGPPKKPRWLIAFFVLIVMAALGALAGFYVMNFLRLGPLLEKKDAEALNAPMPVPSATPAPEVSPTPAAVVPSETPVTTGSAADAAPAGVMLDGTANALPANPEAVPTPEVPKAEPVTETPLPVQPAVPVAAVPAETPAATFPPPGEMREIKISATKKTKIRIVRDKQSSSSVYNGTVNPAMAPLSFKGYYFWIKATDPGAIKVTINGQAVTGPECGVEIR